MNVAVPAAPIRRFALLVGVNQYDNGDDLLAPRNDVIMWFKILRRLGVPPADIVVVTSPMLTAGELDSDDAPLYAADTRGMTQAWSAFRERLRANAGANAFVFASGHGRFRMSDNLYTSGYKLYLSDFDGESNVGMGPEAGQLPFQMLFEFPDLVEVGKPTLTIVADICRATAALPPEAVALERDLEKDFGTKAVVLAATQPGHDCYERCYEGVWQGQLTWAAATILGNWPRGRLGDGTPYVRISASQLRDTIAGLLAVFNDPDHRQAPTLFGADRPGPFLFPGADAPVSRYADVAPSHEFGGGTSDFWGKSLDSTGWDTHLATCGSPDAQTAAGYVESRAWSLAPSGTPTTTDAAAFANALTKAKMTVSANSLTPPTTFHPFRGGPRTNLDDAGKQLSPTFPTLHASAVNTGDSSVTVYVEAWTWNSLPSNLGVRFIVVGPPNKVLDPTTQKPRIPPGDYEFKSNDPKNLNVPSGCVAYSWVDNVLPQT